MRSNISQNISKREKKKRKMGRKEDDEFFFNLFVALKMAHMYMNNSAQVKTQVKRKKNRFTLMYWLVRALCCRALRGAVS